MMMMTVGMPYEVALSLTFLHDCWENFKKFQLHNSPLFLYLWPAPTTQTPPSPPDYVLRAYTPKPQPALNATLPLYITLY